MSVKELEKFKTTYKSNEAVVKVIDGYLEARHKEELRVQAKAKFVEDIEALSTTLPHPEDVANVYLAWREVDIPTDEPELEVVIVDPLAVLDKDGKIATQAVTHKEMRQPTTRGYKWVVELNKGFSTRSTGTPTATTTTNKRAITVKRINGDRLELVGNFPTAKQACDHLRLAVVGDSATRVLARNSYLTEPYNGTDYLTS